MKISSNFTLKLISNFKIFVQDKIKKPKTLVIWIIHINFEVMWIKSTYISYRPLYYLQHCHITFYETCSIAGNRDNPTFSRHQIFEQLFFSVFYLKNKNSKKRLFSGLLIMRPPKTRGFLSKQSSKHIYVGSVLTLCWISIYVCDGISLTTYMCNYIHVFYWWKYLKNLKKFFNINILNFLAKIFVFAENHSTSHGQTRECTLFLFLPLGNSALLRIV